MTVLHRFSAIAVPACCIMLGGASSATPEATCAVRGVWELVSVTNNGKDQPMNGFRQVKIVTQHHFMWLGEAGRRDTLPLKTEADTLRRNSVAGGAGTWTLTGNSYVEHIELFSDPAWLGKPWKATCRVEGNLWYHSWPLPQDSTGVSRDSIAHFVEVWKKIE